MKSRAEIGRSGRSDWEWKRSEEGKKEWEYIYIKETLSGFERGFDDVSFALLSSNFSVFIGINFIHKLSEVSRVELILQSFAYFVSLDYTVLIYV